MTAWDNHRSEIAEALQTRNIRHFRWWGAVRRTMVVINPLILIREALELIGNIHQRYHLLRLTRATDIDFRGLRTVVEIGGGYGAMCAAVYDRGFTGRYVIYDLPEMHQLQRYYLRQRGIYKDVVFTTDIEDLAPGYGESLLIAMWSLSEIPPAERPDWTRMQGFRYRLFGYQIEFGGFNNRSYFRHLAEMLGGTWKVFRAPHLGRRNYYAISQEEMAI